MVKSSAEGSVFHQCSSFTSSSKANYLLVVGFGWAASRVVLLCCPYYCRCHSLPAIKIRGMHHAWFHFAEVLLTIGISMVAHEG